MTKKLFSTLSTLTTESSHMYFLWVKTNLTGSKGHISVRIDQKWPKWRHFGHKMTSYVKIGVRYDKKFFFNIIYSYYWVISYILFGGKNGVKWVKKPYICSNCPKTAKKTSFWPQNDVIRRNWGEIWQKNFFQHYLHLLLSHLIYTFLG